MKSLFRADTLPPLALLVATAIYLSTAYSYPPAARAVPAGVAWTMLVLLVLDLVSRTPTSLGAALKRTLNPGDGAALSRNKRLVVCVVDREGAAQHGITAIDVDKVLNAELGQRIVSTIFTETQQYRATLELGTDTLNATALLANICVPSADGNQVPLGSIARMEQPGKREAEQKALIASLNPGEATEKKAQYGAAKEIAAVLWIVGFAALLVVIGILYAVPVFVFASLVFRGRRPLWLAGLIACVAAGVIWVLFSAVLHVELYSGLLLGGA